MTDPGRELPAKAVSEIHVYGPDAHHDTAYIVANREGLKQLWFALKEAFDTGSASIEAFTGDGEGFSLQIAQCEKMEYVVTPYTADYAQDSRTDALKPWYLVKVNSEKKTNVQF